MEPAMRANELVVRTRAQWRDWLAQNCETRDEIWLVMYRKGSGTSSVDYGAAIEEALCFGWVDSKAIRRDEVSRYQRFSPRRPTSRWSKVNRERVERLIERGLMAGPGQAVIDLAKRKGTWDANADAESGIVPDDLTAALSRNRRASDHFDAFPPSSRKRILGWISTAKRAETRMRRIEQTVALAEHNRRAQH